MNKAFYFLLTSIIFVFCNDRHIDYDKTASIQAYSVINFEESIYNFTRILLISLNADDVISYD